MELHARPEPKKGHEDVVDKLESRIADKTQQLSGLWEVFLDGHNLEEPTHWPSEHDRLFREEFPEAVAAKDVVMDALEELENHLVSPEEAAQNHAIMVSLRGQSKITDVVHQYLLLPDDFTDIIQSALQHIGPVKNEENIIHLKRPPVNLSALTAENLLQIEAHASKLLESGGKVADKYGPREELENLASWCSYWGNLGHGSDVYIGCNYL